MRSASYCLSSEVVKDYRVMAGLRIKDAATYPETCRGAGGVKSGNSMSVTADDQATGFGGSRESSRMSPKDKRYASQVATADRATVMVSDHHCSADQPQAKARALVSWRKHERPGNTASVRPGDRNR